ncbi:uncharacterized protein [Amphiura filiformis]|uniref:uncharacterized protein n=1 Tax=Amphiura filiformis TaxID=82378 RepID=UPI003B226DA0
MASRIVLTLLALTLASVVFAEWEISDDDLTNDDDNLTVDQVEDYIMSKRNNVEADRYHFLQELMNFDKRGRKLIGSCKTPGGKVCALCNLRVRNKSDMRRYIACHNSRRG